MRSTSTSVSSGGRRDQTTLLLKDFSDYANAGARASPNNAVLIDVAPLSISMETFTPGERFFITNHEVAHVAAMDVWNRRDARWRRFFRGKPMPIQEHPDRSSTPGRAPREYPRWYLEGSAVFFETGCREASAVRKAAMTKWSGVRGSATMRNSTRRSA